MFLLVSIGVPVSMLEAGAGTGEIWCPPALFFRRSLLKIPDLSAHIMNLINKSPSYIPFSKWYFYDVTQAACCSISSRAGVVSYCPSAVPELNLLIF